MSLRREGPAAGDAAVGAGYLVNADAALDTKFPGLRPYQQNLLARTDAAIAAGQRRILQVVPTGGGKTITAAAKIAEVVRQGGRAVFVAHRREIIGQASRKLHAAGLDHGVILAQFPGRPGEAAQVASVQTLHARAVRSSAIEMPPADLVVVDEAHHVRARSYREILAAYPNAVILGMTATPCRGDGRGLGNVFDALIEGPPVAELIADGYLVPARIYAPSRPDLTGIRVQRGDYVESQLAERMDQAQLVGDIVSHWHRLAERRRTVVFATGVKHSAHLRDQFRCSGVLAEHIDGGTPTEERDAILARLVDGTVEVVVNCMVLTEGFDCPDIGCLVLARPTKSLGLYRQMIGRALRPAPGKVDALILDHTGAVFSHGFPEDPIAWTLAEDQRAENKAHAARGTHKAPALVDCPECRAVRFEGQPCPACGWRPRPKPAAIEVADGELAAVDRQRRPTSAITYDAAEKRKFYSKLLWIAQERGYKRGWAANKFREKFKDWPPWRYVDPQPPDEAVRSWVRSRQIAYAKAQQAQREAAR